MKKVLCICLCLLFLSHVHGQFPQFRFEHINTSDGLAHVSVQAIYQDHLGYLWIGTWNGLSRYDGHRIDRFLYEPNQPQSLVHGTIYEIDEDHLGNIWLATEGGLSKYIRSENHFISHHQQSQYAPVFGERFTALAVGSSGQVWTSNQYYSSRGLQYWQAGQDSFTSVGNIHAAQIFKTDASWWVHAGAKGLFCLNPNKQEITPAATIYPALRALRGQHIHTLAERNGLLAISTAQGLYSFRGGILQKLQKWPATPAKALLIDHAEGIWMGTEGGLLYQPTRSESVQQITHQAQNPFSLSANEVNCLFEDRQHNLWIGTERGGLNRLYLYQNHAFRSISSYEFGVARNSMTTYAILKTKDAEQIWVGTNLGIFVFDAATHQRLAHIVDALPDRQIRSLYEDAKGQIWAGSLHGQLMLFSQKDRSTYRVSSSQQAGGSIRHIASDANEKLWFSERKLHRQMREEFQPFFNELPSFASRRRLPYIWDFDFLDSCRLVIADNQGVFMYDHCLDSIAVLKKSFMSESRKKMTVFDVLVDGEWLWMGLWGGGLAKMNLSDSSQHIQYYGLNNGLPGNHVYGIVKDKYAMLWLSTNQGLARLNPKTGYIQPFSQEDGLVSNEFDSGAFFQAADGEIFFGGRNGVVRFYPTSVMLAKRQNRLFPHLTRVEVSGKNFPLPPGLAAHSELHFGYESNQSISFTFSAFNYINSQDTRYRYRLLGHEQDWSPATSVPQARYTQLAPGDYTFEIAASENNDFSEAAIRRSSVHIQPLLYQQRWFQVLGIGLFFGLFAALIYLRTRRLNRRERTLLEYKVALAKQEALAAQFDHHFTFNSLNSIQRFLMEQEKQQAIRYISKFGKLIRRVMHQARQQQTSIEDELQSLELYVSLEQLRVRQPFEFKIKLDPAIDPFNTEIPSMIIQPFVENAIWHGLTPAERKGHIQLAFERIGKLLIISIQDNGIGRKAAAELKAASSLQHESRAMTLVRERLALLKAYHGQEPKLIIIDVEDEVGNAAGTRVEIHIPMEE